MTQSRWRKHARQVIEQTLRDLLSWNPSATLAEKREVLRAVYPFGERAYHPYRIWCSEVRLALGLAPTKKKQERWNRDITEYPLFKTPEGGRSP